MKFKENIKKSYKKLIYTLPSKLPVGMNEFDQFCKSVFDTYDLPDAPSYRQAIASMIMHLGPTEARASKRYFAASIYKAMANQIAYENIQLIKKHEAEEMEKQKQLADAALEQKDNNLEPQAASETVVS